MGKGKFINQKLGKNVSRKLDLLKSQLAGRESRKTISPTLNRTLSKKGINRNNP